MIQQRVLYALQLAIQSDGKDRVAYEELRRVDPVLRGSVRRGIQKAIREALFATTVPSVHPEGATHLMRLSFLYASNQLSGVAPDDIEAVQKQYQGLPPVKKPSGFWGLSLLTLGIVVFAGVFLSLSLQDGGRKKRIDALMRPAPSPSGAFAQGGAPTTQNTALYHLLTEPMPSYIIALDRTQRLIDSTDVEAKKSWQEELEKSRAEILSESTKKTLGASAFAQLQRVIEAAEAVTRSPQEEARAKTDLFMESVGAFNDELAALGVGFFIDSDVISSSNNRFAVIYSFAVENVDLFSIEEKIVRALTLRRIDKLNLSQALLGFTRPQLREALLLREQVDDLLVSYVLPGLAPDASIVLVDEDTELLAPEWQGPVEKRAGEIIRDEYGSRLGTNAPQIGELLDKRRRLFVKWNKDLSDRGIHLLPPESLEGKSDYETEFAGLVPKAELEEFLSLQEKLRTEEAAQTLADARKLLATSVARHEVQHRADFSLAKQRKTPPALIEYVGMEVSAEGRENKFATQTKDELSAYLGELARDEMTTKVNLTLLSRFLLNRELWGGAECYVAFVVFQEVGKELGFAVPPLLQSGQIQREKVAALYLQITQKSRAEIQAAAQRAWKTQFGEDLPEMKPASPHTK